MCSVFPRPSCRSCPFLFPTCCSHVIYSSPHTSWCPAPSPVFPCVHSPMIPPVNPIPTSSQPVSPMSFVPSPQSPQGPTPSPDSWPTHPPSSRFVPNPQCGPVPPGLLNSVLPVFSVIFVFSMVFLSHLLNAFSILPILSLFAHLPQLSFGGSPG